MRRCLEALSFQEMSKRREKPDRNGMYRLKKKKKAKNFKWNGWALHTTGNELIDKYTFLLKVDFDAINISFLSQYMCSFMLSY